MQKAGPWTRTGILEVSTLPCPALALSSGPLWTMRNHILEEPPKHKRIDGGSFLEIFCYSISNGLSTSRLMIASLFLEKTCFNPSENMHYISDQPLTLHHQFWCKCVFGSGGEVRREVLGLYLAHCPSQRCGWNMVVVFGEPPWTLPIEVATLKPWKSLGAPRNTGWGIRSLLGRNQLAKPCCLTNV